MRVKLTVLKPLYTSALKNDGFNGNIKFEVTVEMQNEPELVKSYGSAH